MTRLIERRRWKWGGQYGRTHNGWRLFILGAPVFRWRKPVDRRAV